MKNNSEWISYIEFNHSGLDHSFLPLENLGFKAAHIEQIKTKSFVTLKTSLFPSLSALHQTRKDLEKLLWPHQIDFALFTHGGLTPKLIAFDLDSTLIEQEGIDELASVFGKKDEMSKLTHQAMLGELDFSKSIEKRVALLKSMTQEQVLSIASLLKIRKGALQLFDFLHFKKIKTVLLSGGFTDLAHPIQQILGIDETHANILEYENGALTGKLIPPLIDAQAKADFLTQICERESILLSETMAIGDGANDVKMIETAQIGIGLHPKPKLRDVAPINLCFSSSLLSIQKILEVITQR